MKNSVYSMFVILSGVLWGIISIFLKGLYSAGFSALQVMFFRGFISSVFMAIFLFVKDKSLLKFKLKDIWLFLGTGVISLTFFSLCYFYTILESGASVAVILLYTSPIFPLCSTISIASQWSYTYNQSLMLSPSPYTGTFSFFNNFDMKNGISFSRY